MNIIYEKGSPDDILSRLPKEQRCYELLDGLNLDYWRCDHRDECAETMEACREIEKTLGAGICKNLFLCNRQHTKFYLLMMPGEKPFKTKELSSQLGCSRLSFADGNEMEQYLDITPGSVSVLGLMNDKDNVVQLLVDKDLLNDEFIGCHPCINTSTLKIYSKDLFNVILPKINHEKIVVELVGIE